MLILAKYPYNTPATYHFLIKKKRQTNSKKNSKIQKKINNFFFFFIIIFLKKMDVEGCVIFQLRLDLPVTVRLQRLDDRFYSSVRRVPIRNHQLADLSRAQARRVAGVHCAQRQCWKEAIRSPVDCNIF
jgi:hypothetical protein